MLTANVIAAATGDYYLREEDYETVFC